MNSQPKDWKINKSSNWKTFEIKINTSSCTRKCTIMRLWNLIPRDCIKSAKLVKPTSSYHVELSNFNIFCCRLQQVDRHFVKNDTLKFATERFHKNVKHDISNCEPTKINKTESNGWLSDCQMSNVCVWFHPVLSRNVKK